MRLSPLHSQPSIPRVVGQQSSYASLGGAEKGMASPRGMPAFQRDTFEVGASRGTQFEKLQQSAEALLRSVQALVQLLQLAQGGGASPAGGGGAPGAIPPSAPGQANPSGGSTPSPVNVSGDAKVGAGMPPALAQYQGAIESAAAKAGVPAGMLVGQIWQESRGNLQATSTNGGNGLTDTGLMQINPNTFKELQSKYPELQGKDLADPETNILAGAYYMKDMKAQFGSWELALRGYNSGPNGVDRSNPDALPAGTGDATYVQKVMQFWNTVDTGQGTLPP